MYRLIDEPAPLVEQLEKHPQTLIHGDLRLHNMGLSDDRVVLIDWELVGRAPPAVDLAWYLIISASRIDASREDVIADYREIAGERFDPVAWDLACIGALMWLGWNKAIDITENPDPAIREQERSDLDWWIARVRAALESWSPV
jgi:aminoglycoside phosphotransferase (APT) family kinase protein